MRDFFSSGRRLLFRHVAIGTAVVTLGSRSFAHSIITGSEPAAGSTVTGPMVRIRLVFSSRLDVFRSRVAMRDASNAQTLIPIVGDDTGVTLNGTFEAPRPGPWQIDWSVLSTDGHIVRGRIPFSIAG